jgi:hypothetical protein
MLELLAMHANICSKGKKSSKSYSKNSKIHTGKDALRNKTKWKMKRKTEKELI